MLTATFPFIVACLFAGLLGFAAHRASICTVRGLAEAFSARTSYMLLSIGKAALWVIALTLPFLWLMPGSAAHGVNGWPLTFSALAGGLVFGFGAAINGGCAYSTMTRLMDGEIRMALSLAGFAIGIVMFLVLIDFEWLMRPTKAIVLTGSLRSSTMIATFLLLFWAVYELARIWRQRARHLRLKDMILSPQYRLSTAALLIGVSSAAIFLLIGAPGYTVTLQNFVVGTLSGGTLPDAARWVLLLSVLVGMLLSTLQRGSFRLEWRPRRSWLRNIFGGALMGLGTAMIPGGNDSLVLYGIPSFSPHALPAFAALIVGTAAGVLAMKHLGGIDMRVVCSNDIYRVEAQPTGSILNSHPPSSQTGSA